ncbi:MAG: nitrilase-related carbon-nitrogen hydrolase [Vulcanimicrobiaceae bacterium]
MSPDSAARLRVAIIQTKPTKGHFAENLADVCDAFVQLAAWEQTPNLIVLPEAALTGYFLEGAVYDLARGAEHFAAELAAGWQATASAQTVDIVCGFFENASGTYYNSALYLRVTPNDHEIIHIHRKIFLPTYGVFDEERFLSRGHDVGVFTTQFGPAAMLICEDVWHSLVPTIAAVKGARLLIVPSASPGRGVDGEGDLGSIERWKQTLSNVAGEHGIYILYAGLAGFEGGKGMTGSSCVVDPHGRIIVQGDQTEACILAGDLDARELDRARAQFPLLGDLSSVLTDLVHDLSGSLHSSR